MFSCMGFSYYWCIPTIFRKELSNFSTRDRTAPFQYVGTLHGLCLPYCKLAFVCYPSLHSSPIFQKNQIATTEVPPWEHVVKPKLRFISLSLCFSLLAPKTVCLLAFFRPSNVHSWQRTPCLIIVRELLCYRGGAGGSQTIGFEGKRSDKLERLEKESLSGLPRSLGEERQRARARRWK